MSHPIEMTVNGLATYMLLSPARQRKILKDFKYPEPEGRVQAHYYREAYRILWEFYNKGHSTMWLMDEAAYLDSLVADPREPYQKRIKHNARTLQTFAKRFGNRKITGIEPGRSLIYSDAGLSIE